MKVRLSVCALSPRLPRSRLTFDSSLFLPIADDEVLPSGTVLGLTECLLRTPVAHSYTAASFVHLLFFDRASVLMEADRNPELLKSLWWRVAAQVGR